MSEEKPKRKVYHLFRPPTKMQPLKTWCGMVAKGKISKYTHVTRDGTAFLAVSPDDPLQGSNCGVCMRTVRAMRNPRYSDTSDGNSRILG